MTTNKQLYIATPDKLYYYRRSQAPLVYNVASQHSLFWSNGYVGPKPKTKPLPEHAYEYYRDVITLKRAYNRNYSAAPYGSDNVNGNALSTNPSSVSFTPPLDYTNTYRRALDKLNDASRGSLDISVDLMQMKSVARMLNVSEQIQDYTSKFVKRKFGIIRGIASLRLQYMYGVKPLLSTLYGAADESLNVVINQSERFRVRATDYVKPSRISVQSYIGPYSFANSNSVKLSTTLGVDIRTDQHDISRWSSLNPISIAYELMPWSFVADWFFDIGGYLRNMETYLLYANKFRSGYRTDFAAFSGKASDFYQFTAEPKGTDIWSVNYQGLRFKRSVLSSYPAPYLPKLQADLGSSRLLNGAALLAQFLGRR